MTDHNHGEAPGQRRAPIDSEIDVRRAVEVGLWLAGATIGALVIGYFIYLGLAKWTIADDPTPSPLAEVNRNVAPPAPNLQVQPEKELAEMRAAEHAQLSSWGWVDEARGLAHMPVEVAIDRLAVPEPTEPAAPAASPVDEAPAATGTEAAQDPAAEGASPANPAGSGH